MVVGVNNNGGNSTVTGFRDHFSVLHIIAADGKAAPPMFAFKGKRYMDGILNGALPGSSVTFQQNGYFVKENQLDIIKHCINNFRKNDETLILTLDRCKSHFYSEAIDYARDNNVVIICLPPNTTHCLQPLDRAPFKCAKRVWGQVCREWRRDNAGIKMTKYNVCELYTEVHQMSMRVKLIKQAFSTTGMFPLNPLAIVADAESANQKWAAIANGGVKYESSKKDDLIKMLVQKDTIIDEKDKVIASLKLKLSTYHRRDGTDFLKGAVVTEWKENVDLVELASDASEWGCGAVLDSEYISLPWTADMISIAGIGTKKRNMPLCEAMGVAVAVSTWRSKLAGKRVLFHSDCQAAVFGINKGHSSINASPWLQAVYLFINHICITHNIMLRCEHIAGANNHAPDLVSRGKEEQYLLEMQQQCIRVSHAHVLPVQIQLLPRSPLICFPEL